MQLKKKYKAGGLVGGQVKLDKNKDGVLNKKDFKMMMSGGKMKMMTSGGKMKKMMSGGKMKDMMYGGKMMKKKKVLSK